MEALHQEPLTCAVAIELMIEHTICLYYETMTLMHLEEKGRSGPHRA